MVTLFAWISLLEGIHVSIHQFLDHQVKMDVGKAKDYNAGTNNKLCPLHHDAYNIGFLRWIIFFRNPRSKGLLTIPCPLCPFRVMLIRKAHKKGSLTIGPPNECTTTLLAKWSRHEISCPTTNLRVHNLYVALCGPTWHGIEIMC